MTLLSGTDVRRETRIRIKLWKCLALDVEMLPRVRAVRLSKRPADGFRSRMLLFALFETLVELGAQGVEEVALCVEDSVCSSIKVAIRGGSDGTDRGLEYAVVLPRLLELVAAARGHVALPLVEVHQGPEGEDEATKLALRDAKWQVFTGDGDTVSCALGLREGAWIDVLDGSAGPPSAMHLLVAELIDRFCSTQVLGDEAPEFVKWLGADALPVLQLTRALSPSDCDYLRGGLTARHFGRRSPLLLKAIVEAYVAARPRDAAPLGVEAFVEHVAVRVFEALCKERPDILVALPDAPYAYAPAAVRAFLTLLLAPCRRSPDDSEAANVGCLRTRLSTTEYSALRDCFPAALAPPPTLAELLELTLRPGIAAEPSSWSSRTLAYVDRGRVHALDFGMPPTPPHAVSFASECEAIIERVSRGLAPSDVMRDVSAAFEAACRFVDAARRTGAPRFLASTDPASEAALRHIAEIVEEARRLRASGNAAAAAVAYALADARASDERMRRETVEHSKREERLVEKWCWELADALTAYRQCENSLSGADVGAVVSSACVSILAALPAVQEPLWRRTRPWDRLSYALALYEASYGLVEVSSDCDSRRVRLLRRATAVVRHEWGGDRGRRYERWYRLHYERGGRARVRAARIVRRYGSVEARSAHHLETQRAALVVALERVNTEYASLRGAGVDAVAAAACAVLCRSLPSSVPEAQSMNVWASLNAALDRLDAPWPSEARCAGGDIREVRLLRRARFAVRGEHWREYCAPHWQEYYHERGGRARHFALEFGSVERREAAHLQRQVDALAALLSSWGPRCAPLFDGDVDARVVVMVAGIYLGASEESVATDPWAALKRALGRLGVSATPRQHGQWGYDIKKVWLLRCARDAIPDAVPPSTVCFRDTARDAARDAARDESHDAALAALTETELRRVMAARGVGPPDAAGDTVRDAARPARAARSRKTPVRTDL